MPGEEPTAARPETRSDGERLDSWKEIAAYLKCSERTVRRWENEGLPVRRHPHNKRAAIYAYKTEIDDWWRNGHERLERTSSQPPASSQSRLGLSFHWWKPVSLSALALLILLSAGTYLWQARSASGPRRIESIAVLPLENLSRDSDQDYFADGMTEELITDLSKITALRVISRTSTMQYKQTRKTVPEIARELHVDAVVEGAVARSGNRVRITAQLIHAPGDTHLWAEEYQRDSGDVLAMESEVARDIAGQVKAKLTVAEQARLASTRAVDPEAHEAYLKGRFHWNKRNEDELRKAVGFFELAIAKEPNYAAAYAGLADCHSLLAYYGFLPDTEGYPKAKEEALRAIELDESLAEAHASLVFVKTFYDWDWEGAERESRRAIELNPSYATAHQWYGDALLQMGRLDEAITEEKRALELDPLSLVINRDLGDALNIARRYDEAIVQYRRTLDLDPGFMTVHCSMGFAYVRKSLFKEGIAECEKELALYPQRLYALAGVAQAYAAAGRANEARRVLVELDRRSKREFVPAVYRAEIYASLGEKDRALDWLRKSYDDRSIASLAEIKVDPQFDPLRSDARFQELLHRINLSH
jgi:TolB-like protein/Tfp pilus assembly protein PilF